MNIWQCALSYFLNDGVKTQREFLSRENVIGIGWGKNDEENGTVNSFCNLAKKGDLVLVKCGLSWNKGIALVQLADDYDANFNPPKSEYAEFPFTHTRKITILGFYNDEIKKLHDDDTNFSPGKTFNKFSSEWRENFVKDWYMYIMENKSIGNYVELLKANKNIILTGAPGTGKTYLAKQIANKLTLDNDENHPHVEFVQFHPSYDYTDFVEGLRPVFSDEEKIGFELKNGIFKDFCGKAIRNKKDNFKEAYDSFVKDLEQSENLYFDELKTLKDKVKFRVELNRNGNLNYYTYNKDLNSFNSERSGSLTREQLYSAYIGKYKYWESYYGGVIEYLKSQYKLLDTPESDDQKYVFIIDEINRGEIAKIFGELFYSIDSGYRGEKGKIKTQYNNLANDDIFESGFFVPENVYIIGTMNDIDRSVESMDFAIRRRFAWVEVTAEESQSILKELKNQAIKQIVCNRMNNLNKAISKIDGLSSAFHIGGAYFLKLNQYGDNFDDLWKYHIKGLLAEYLRGLPDADKKLKELEMAYNDDKDNG